VDRYGFLPRRPGSARGDELHTAEPEAREFGEVVAIDVVALTVDIKKRLNRTEDHPTSIFEFNDLWVEGALRVTDAVGRVGDRETGMEHPGHIVRARDLLMRRGPRITEHEGGPLVANGRAVWTPHGASRRGSITPRWRSRARRAREDLHRGAHDLRSGAVGRPTRRRVRAEP
jgi:hypothetical protein